MNRTKLKWGVLLAAGVLYYILIRYTNFGIPCLFYKVTHFRCPGCGITHMIYELSLMHIRQAMEANYFLFWSIPILIVLCFYELLRKRSKKEYKVMQFLGYSYLVSLILWMIIRNILNV